MPTPDAATIPALRLERTLDAPPERVFRAWTEREALERWFAPEPDFEIEAKVDARVGGVYSIAMRTPQGETHLVTGTFREVDPPSRLVFTWAWQSAPEAATLVTVEFAAANGGTALTLLHEQLASEESRMQHEHGWNACLDRLPEELA